MQTHSHQRTSSMFQLHVSQLQCLSICRREHLHSFCSFQIDSVKERENAISKFSKKRHNIFHAKEKFQKIMAPFTTKYISLKNRKKNVSIKQKKYRSLSAVCEVLSKVSSRATLEDKRRERTLLFKKNICMIMKKIKNLEVVK